jgi:hypothetical protein
MRITNSLPKGGYFTGRLISIASMDIWKMTNFRLPASFIFLPENIDQPIRDKLQSKSGLGR